MTTQIRFVSPGVVAVALCLISTLASHVVGAVDHGTAASDWHEPTAGHAESSLWRFPVLLADGDTRDRPDTTPMPDRHAAQAETATVNTPSDGFLALRSEPTARLGRRLAKIPSGTRLRLVGCVAPAAGEFWCRTNYGGQRGWVFERYLLRGEAVDDDEIAQAVAEVCPPDWCEVKLLKAIAGYAAVDLLCNKPHCDGAVAYLERSNGGWTLVDYGSGLTREDLEQYGFPPDIARRLEY